MRVPAGQSLMAVLVAMAADGRVLDLPRKCSGTGVLLGEATAWCSRCCVEHQMARCTDMHMRVCDHCCWLLSSAVQSG